MQIRSLQTELQQKAEKELNEVPDRICEDLKYIKEWLKKQPHLRVREDDQYLIGFLRGCKFSLQRTKEKLDSFYTIRTLLPEFFDRRDPFLPEIQEVLKANALLVLPKTADPAGPRIMMFRWDDCHPEKVTFVEAMKVMFMSLDILLTEDDNCMVAGIQVWAEYKAFNPSYLLQFTPSILKKTLLCLQSAYPVRIKGAVCTNVPSTFEIIYNMMRPFMSDKLKSRMNVYTESHFDELYKDIPKSILPKDYGGDSDSIENLGAEWRKKLESYQKWFLEDEKYRSEESLRPGNPKTSADLFGVEGTFRKLAID